MTRLEKIQAEKKEMLEYREFIRMLQAMNKNTDSKKDKPKVKKLAIKDDKNGH